MNYLHGYDHPLDDKGIIRAVIAEYDRAKGKHGEHTLDGALATDLTRLAALVEEVGEVAEAMTYDAGERAAALKKELVQVANVALTWASTL